MCVTAMARPARPSEATAEPTLKPNQPTHNMPAPAIVKPRLTEEKAHCLNRGTGPAHRRTPVHQRRRDDGKRQLEHGIHRFGNVGCDVADRHLLRVLEAVEPGKPEPVSAADERRQRPPPGVKASEYPTKYQSRLTLAQITTTQAITLSTLLAAPCLRKKVR